MPSVATVLAGDAKEQSLRLASAVVVRQDGVLLTAYHVVKDAREVQIKLKNGETYDDVALLGVDQRRDIAALRVSATNLPTLPIASLDRVKPGMAVYSVSQAAALPWTASSGLISAVRMADEVPGTGAGYRLLQFTAPVSPGSSGGLLVDSSGRLLGIIVGAAPDGQNLNFAVPIESVIGLANMRAGTAFSSGSSLELLRTATVSAANKPRAGIDVQGPEKSEPISSRDPEVILRQFRTIYVRSKTVWMKDEVIKNALRQTPEFKSLGLVIVENAKVADALLVTDRVLFTWDFTYSLSHQNTSIVLASGKFTQIDGITAANTIAKDVLKRVKAARAPVVEKSADKDQPKN